MNMLQGKIIRDSGLHFYDDSIRIIIPESYHSQLESYIDKNIVCGIRPEDIHTDANVSFTAKADIAIDVIELMGNESYLYGSTGSNPMVARLQADLQSSLSTGESIELLFDMSKVHFFDNTTGKVIIGRLAVENDSPQTK